MSPGLCNDMEDAVQRADITLIHRMILHMEDEDKGLAREIKVLADGFEYAEILRIMRKGV